MVGRRVAAFLSNRSPTRRRSASETRATTTDNPGNLYVSDSEESSEDDDLDDHEEAFSSPGGRALSPENKLPVLLCTLRCTSEQRTTAVPTLCMLSSQQREAFSLAGSSDAPQPPASSRRHGHRLFNRRRKSETHAQSASMQSAAAVAAADTPVNGASGSDRKRGIGRGLFVRRQHSPPLDAGGGGITHSSSYSSNASASGYTSSPVLSRYPIPQQIHRVGVDCDNANSSSHNSTADHDFYPPIPLDCDGTSTAERLLRSQFVSPSAGTAANSSSNSGASSSAK
eukprot:7458-Heterococcus_DN1.PRE.2